LLKADALWCENKRCSDSKFHDLWIRKRVCYPLHHSAWTRPCHSDCFKYVTFKYTTCKLFTASRLHNVSLASYIIKAVNIDNQCGKYVHHSATRKAAIRQEWTTVSDCHVSIRVSSVQVIKYDSGVALSRVEYNHYSGNDVLLYVIIRHCCYT